ncbi:hypothetical protein [Emticicia agri]|uniref:Outer membrane protein beta-barrel domain-containing protein n=1 Tax=Emticicia agri TaxID=2492393 RepID=A0A4Q5LZ16_9BACT|nr:hypothetical protein [Emticicia agri]RYU95196.1 hypothetical protein EWM59_13170 [Emticicia agri]
MKKLLILTITLLGLQSTFAQQMRVVEQYSLGYGFDKKTSVPTFMYSQTLVMGKKNSFAIGTGFRVTSFFAKGKTYTGTEAKNEKVSFIPYPRANVNTFNIPLILEFQAKKVLIGANIDLIGFAFGKTRDSLTIKNNSGQKLDSLSASPPRLNLALGGRGTTTNQVYIGFRPQEEFTIKVGVNFLFTQYNARYRRNGKDVEFGRFKYDVPLMPFVSLVFNFER